MTKEQLFEWVDTGRELEFNYKGKTILLLILEEIERYAYLSANSIRKHWM